MGWDIYGCIEYQPEVELDAVSALPWRVAIELSEVYDERDYDAFGSLFGLKNHTGLKPLAADRGLPPNASNKAIRLCDGLEHYSWISWEEMNAIDWQEQGTEPDKRLRAFKRDEEGNLELISAAAWNAEIAEVINFSLEEAIEGTVTWPIGAEWDLGNGLIYRALLRTRRDTICEENWKPVWDTMEELSDKYGDSHVRLLVGFCF